MLSLCLFLSISLSRRVAVNSLESTYVDQGGLEPTVTLLPLAASAEGSEHSIFNQHVGMITACFTT